MMKERSASLIRNTTILSFGTVCTKGIMFIMTPLFTRWLTTVDYGTFDLMITYVSLLLPVITLASGEAIFRFILGEEQKENKVHIISSAFLMDIIGLVFLFLICLVWANMTGVDIYTIVCFLVYFSAEVFYNFCMMILRGEKRLNIYTFGNILFVFGLAFFVTIFVFIAKMGLRGILLGYACSDFTSIFVMLIYSKVYKNIKLRKISFKMVKAMLKYSLPMIPNAISWWIVNASDRTLIAFFLGTEFNAIYAVANKVPGLCTTFFGVFHLSWQQNAMETMTDKDRDVYYSSVMNKMFQIVCSVCILILGINYWFFKLLFSVDYMQGIYQAPILVVAIIFSMLGQFIGGIYVAQMKSKKNGATTVIAAISNIVIDLLLIKKIGLYAASLSTLCAYFILFVVRYIDIYKEVKLVFRKKSIVAFCILLYFFVGAYFVIVPLQIINLILSTLYFVFDNRLYVIKILRKLNQISTKK